jgi:hypothetical protein
MEVIKPGHHRQGMRDGRRSVPSGGLGLARPQIHRARQRGVSPTLLLRVNGATQPADQGGPLSLGCLVPGDLQQPQQPEPAQHIMGTTATGQRADITQHPIPQVPAHRRHHITRAVHYQIRQRGYLPGNHSPGTRHIAAALGQFPAELLSLIVRQHPPNSTGSTGRKRRDSAVNGSSAAIDLLAVPRMSAGGGVNGARVSRFDQWALTATVAYPVADGDPIAAPQGPAFPVLYEPATLLITALRIVCGGSVVVTRSMFAQADDEFPIVQGVSATLTAFDGADNDRPTYLLADALDAFRSAYTALSLPAVQADRSLQITIRRLVFAGSRSVDADRLIDLTMSAEALFVKRANLPRGSKGDKIAAGAAALLSGDPELGADGDQIRAFMTAMYRARNAEMHGDDRPYTRLQLLDGTPTDSMPRVLSDAEKLMRRAILTVLAEYTAPAR